MKPGYYHPKLTKNDLQERFNVSLSKLDKSIREGELKYTKVGKSAVRFSEADVEEYIQRHE